MVDLLLGAQAIAQNDPRAPVSVWGADDAMGKDAKSFNGNMWATNPADAFGKYGLGLQGEDMGGGGDGTGVGLGNVHTLGNGDGDPNGNGGIGKCANPPCTGFGVSSSPGKGDHKAKAPNMRPAGPTVVVGSIPREVIQRIVRQNFGRFRVCYEAGLRSNPTLQGRVTARFVIGRDGSVTVSQDGGSDMPDQSVTQCVVRAYQGLSFPAPEGGIVTVTYPILFQPGE
jgi:hypothetical protein